MPPLLTLPSLIWYSLVAGQNEAKAEIGPTLLAIGVGILLWLLLFLFGMLRAPVADRKKLRAQIERLEHEIESLRLRKSDRQRLTEQLSRLRDDLDSIRPVEMGANTHYRRMQLAWSMLQDTEERVLIALRAATSDGMYEWPPGIGGHEEPERLWMLLTEHYGDADPIAMTPVEVVFEQIHIDETTGGEPVRRTADPEKFPLVQHQAVQMMDLTIDNINQPPEDSR